MRGSFLRYVEWQESTSSPNVDHFKKDGSSTFLALKCVLALDPSEYDLFHGEIALLKKVRGEPNIIQMVDSECVPKAGVILILTELGECSFSDFLKKRKREYQQAVGTSEDKNTVPQGGIIGGSSTGGGHSSSSGHDHKTSEQDLQSTTGSGGGGGPSSGRGGPPPSSSGGSSTATLQTADGLSSSPGSSPPFAAQPSSALLQYCDLRVLRDGLRRQHALRLTTSTTQHTLTGGGTSGNHSVTPGGRSRTSGPKNRFGATSHVGTTLSLSARSSLAQRGNIRLAEAFLDSGLSLEEVWLYWGQMLSAICSIHKYRILHSDLKPHNFLMVNGALKLIDFGVASTVENEGTGSSAEVVLK